MFLKNLTVWYLLGGCAEFYDTLSFYIIIIIIIIITTTTTYSWVINKCWNFFHAV